MNRHRKRAQSMIEFALVAPVLLTMLVAVFDFARASYTWSVLAYAAREGGRQAVLANFAPSTATDASVSSAVIAQGIGVSLASAPCPHATTGGATPAPATVNSGYVYILPGVSGGPNAPAGQPAGVGGGGCRLSSPVGADSQPLKIRIVYKFQPFTPFASQFMGSAGFTIQVDSTMYTEF
jgi:TadE-like protein